MMANRASELLKNSQAQQTASWRQAQWLRAEPHSVSGVVSMAGVLQGHVWLHARHRRCHGATLICSCSGPLKCHFHDSLPSRHMKPKSQRQQVGHHQSWLQTHCYDTKTWSTFAGATDNESSRQLVDIRIRCVCQQACTAASTSSRYSCRQAQHKPAAQQSLLAGASAAGLPPRPGAAPRARAPAPLPPLPPQLPATHVCALQHHASDMH